MPGANGNTTLPLPREVMKRVAETRLCLENGMDILYLVWLHIYV